MSRAFSRIKFWCHFTLQGSLSARRQVEISKKTWRKLVLLFLIGYLLSLWIIQSPLNTRTSRRRRWRRNPFSGSEWNRDWNRDRAFSEAIFHFAILSPPSDSSDAQDLGRRRARRIFPLRPLHLQFPKKDSCIPWFNLTSLGKSTLPFCSISSADLLIRMWFNAMYIQHGLGWKS